MNHLLLSKPARQLFSAKYYFIVGLLLFANLCFAKNASTPLVTISSSPTSACKGEPIKFTAVAVNGGALPVYQWLVNGFGVGINQNTFTSTSLADGDMVMCRITASGGGETVNSNMLTVTILSPPIIVQHDTAICPNIGLLLQADVTGAAYAKYKTVDFSNQFNFNISTNTFGLQFVNCPTGNVTFNGIPFILYPWSNTYTGWNAINATGPDPRKLFIPVNEDGVVAINLLANTYYGVPGPTSYVSVSFWANGGEVYKKDLIGDQDIRDYNAAQFTNQINNVSTINAWLSPNRQNRLDNVRIQMPSPTRIDSIVINDHGGNGQRIFILGATVEKTPLGLKWSTGETTPEITVYPSQPTTYTVMATNGVASCSSSSINVSMTIPLVPSVSISQSVNNVCPGTSITFTASAINTGKEPTYQWLVNGNSAGINSLTFTTGSLVNGDVVTCRMTPNLHCVTIPTTTSNALTVTLLPQATVDAGHDVTIHQGDQTQLNATVSGDILSMQWSPATGLDNPGILRPTATPTATTKYTLLVQSQNTCTAIDSLTVKVLPANIVIPNAITPNHDGVNDVWNIQYLDQFTTCTVNVFNRYGQRLFSSIGYQQPWNGTYKNKLLPAGTYYYIIDLKDGSPVKSGYVVVVY